MRNTVKTPQVILITGATGAIGGALANYYAEPGVILHLHGRNPAGLERVAQECRAAGAEVMTYRNDLSDTRSLQPWLEQLDNKSPLDLFIACAGMNINIGDDLSGEKPAEMEALLDLNVKVTLLMAGQVATLMRQRGTGKIALMSSLAAYHGLPVTPSYCASKAAVKAYGEALRGGLAPLGVGVTVIMPGYVASEMCYEMPGPKPFLLQPEQAAEIIARGLIRNKARITFPFPLNIGCWFLSVLPYAVSGRILALLDYHGK
ncbi:Short-chain dehydrogenase [Amphritea atlantica]|uniref:Short-chain dehydrogenase n=1 Tax=Amphritea atlantica TaxID=355243 RepID=A0A1H9K893_9GAMM|nr:SDR family NAD(P)-dependent oxidoreductase [Amphritea atlantica]SEQ95143.1 Short-chain dehydrogenase [Amphritea atlantica]